MCPAALLQPSPLHLSAFLRIWHVALWCARLPLPTRPPRLHSPPVLHVLCLLTLSSAVQSCQAEREAKMCGTSRTRLLALLRRLCLLRRQTRTEGTPYVCHAYAVNMPAGTYRTYPNANTPQRR